MLDTAYGVTACALVEASSGLVWYQQPDATNEKLWEASVDYWRLHCRLQDCFSRLGALGAIGVYHHEGMLTVVPCLRDPEVLLICIADNSAVDWKQWQRKVRELGVLMAAQLKT